MQSLGWNVWAWCIALHCEEIYGQSSVPFTLNSTRVGNFWFNCDGKTKLMSSFFYCWEMSLSNLLFDLNIQITDLDCINTFHYMTEKYNSNFFFARLISQTENSNGNIDSWKNIESVLYPSFFTFILMQRNIIIIVEIMKLFRFCKCFQWMVKYL